jgi:hypothetical protein
MAGYLCPPENENEYSDVIMSAPNSGLETSHRLALSATTLTASRVAIFGQKQIFSPNGSLQHQQLATANTRANAHGRVVQSIRNADERPRTPNSTEPWHGFSLSASEERAGRGGSLFAQVYRGGSVNNCEFTNDQSRLSRTRTNVYERLRTFTNVYERPRAAKALLPRLKIFQILDFKGLIRAR